jgi:hypothetical protein
MNAASTASKDQVEAAARAVVILGMHRSGTSCLAGSLQQCGLHLGRVHERDPYNRKGNRENDRIVALNEAVLAHSGGSWDAPPGCLQWDSSHADERDAIANDLRAAGTNWGFKDPRTLLTLRFWQPVLGAGVCYVGAFRHPARVVRSLQSRGRMSLDGGRALSLWRAYNERLLAQYAQNAFPLISFDLPEPAYLDRLDEVSRWLGLSPPVDGAFFDRDLRSDALLDDDHAAVDEECRRLHDRLLAASAKPWVP